MASDVDVKKKSVWKPAQNSDGDGWLFATADLFNFTCLLVYTAVCVCVCVCVN